ncbi:putative transforming protein E6 [Four-toed hedgehog papillomavirus]|nr:putative transforming protein E6 [Four-toed hedgehog papillomavirus]
MDTTEHPKSLTQLSQALGIPILQLEVPCTYCFQYLSCFDKVSFEVSDLSLVWKNDREHGVCQPCLRKASYLEFVLYSQDKWKANQTEERTGRHLPAHPVRCMYCARPLQYPEISELLKRRQDVYLVRGRLRAPCLACKLWAGIL